MRFVVLLLLVAAVTARQLHQDSDVLTRTFGASRKLAQQGGSDLGADMDDADMADLDDDEADDDMLDKDNTAGLIDDEDGFGDDEDEDNEDKDMPTICQMEGDGTVSLPQDRECPNGFQQEGNKCMTPCSTFNLKFVTYTKSADGASCLPTCSGEGIIKMGASCGHCPTGSKYIAALKACVADCPSTLASFPMAAGGPVCSSKCPKDFRFHNATHCAPNSGKGALIKRSNVYKATIVEPGAEAAPVQARKTTPLVCPAGTQEVDGQCYDCDEMQAVIDPVTKQVICRGSCPANYTKTAPFCWDSEVHSGLATWSEEQTTTLLNAVEKNMQECLLPAV